MPDRNDSVNSEVDHQMVTCTDDIKKLEMNGPGSRHGWRLVLWWCRGEGGRKKRELYRKTAVNAGILQKRLGFSRGVPLATGVRSKFWIQNDGFSMVRWVMGSSLSFFAWPSVTWLDDVLLIVWHCVRAWPYPHRHTCNGNVVEVPPRD